MILNPNLELFPELQGKTGGFTFLRRNLQLLGRWCAGAISSCRGTGRCEHGRDRSQQDPSSYFIPWPQEVPGWPTAPHLEPVEGNSRGHLPADAMEAALQPVGALGQLQGFLDHSALGKPLPSTQRLSPLCPGSPSYLVSAWRQEGVVGWGRLRSLVLVLGTEFLKPSCD